MRAGLWDARLLHRHCTTAVSVARNMHEDAKRKLFLVASASRAGDAASEAIAVPQARQCGRSGSSASCALVTCRRMAPSLMELPRFLTPGGRPPTWFAEAKLAAGSSVQQAFADAVLRIPRSSEPFDASIW